MTNPTLVKRPPTRLYEVRTVHGQTYRAEGDVIESGDGWFTLWADQFTLALRVPEADVRAVRQVADIEAESDYAESDLASLLDTVSRVREVATRLLTDDPVENPVQATTTAGLRIREALGEWATT